MHYFYQRQPKPYAKAIEETKEFVIAHGTSVKKYKDENGTRVRRAELEEMEDSTIKEEAYKTFTQTNVTSVGTRFTNI